MGRVSWTREAQDWLEDIFRYISADDPVAAAATVQAIFKKTELLRRHPFAGYPVRQFTNDDVRVLLHGHYRIAYRVARGRDIDILGVFHGALDMDAYLAREPSEKD